MRFLIRAFLGYLIAAGLTVNVSLVLTATLWTSIWTYGWLLLGYFLARVAVWAAFMLFGMLGFGALLMGAWTVDRIKRR